MKGKSMRIAIVGQKDFGKAVLDAFVQRGDRVAGVFLAPEKPGEPADSLRNAAEGLRIPVFALPSLRGCRRRGRHCAHSRSTSQFWPMCCNSYRRISQPSHATARFNTIRRSCRATGDREFDQLAHNLGRHAHRPPASFGPPTGSMRVRSSCRKETPIGPDETVGKVYFGQGLFPDGSRGAIGSRGHARERPLRKRSRKMSRAQATKVGAGTRRRASIGTRTWIRFTTSFAGGDPAPGAWTQYNQKKLQLYDARKHGARALSQIQRHHRRHHGVWRAQYSLTIAAQGGQIEVSKLRYDGGKKLPAPLLCAEAGLCLGAILGS